MSEAKEQFCDWCGEPLGTYAWSRQDGPQACSKPECEREVRDMVRAQEDEARYEAEMDGYSFYGGPGRW